MKWWKEVKFYLFCCIDEKEKSKIINYLFYYYALIYFLCIEGENQEQFEEKKEYSNIFQQTN